MKRMMLCFVILVIGSGFGCEQLPIQSMETETVSEPEGQNTASNLSQVIAPLGNTCTPETMDTDCSAEIAMLTNDECVEFPGVFCSTDTDMCSVQVNAQCYFAKSGAKCMTDADCQDNSLCTVNLCVGDGVCMTGHYQNGTVCEYNDTTSEWWVCQEVASGLQPACLPPEVVPQPECEKHSDCNDNNTCTVDICDSGSCTNNIDSTNSFCTLCETDADCDEFDTASCDNGQLKITSRTCVEDQGAKRCSSAVVEVNETCTYGCSNSDVACAEAECQTDQDCFDGSFCSIDSCEAGWCIYTHNPVADCTLCSSDDDCAHLNYLVCDPSGNWVNGYEYTCKQYDGAQRCAEINPYTHDTCEFGCDNSTTECNPECTADADCEDGYFCTTDSCSDEGVCEYEDVPASVCTTCATDADCAHLNYEECSLNYKVDFNFGCVMSQGAMRCADLSAQNTLCEFGCNADTTSCIPECNVNQDCESKNVKTCNNGTESTEFYGCVAGSCQVSGTLESGCQYGCGDNNTCATSPPPECEEDLDCDLGTVCSIDTCQNGQCVNTTSLSASVGCTECTTSSDCTHLNTQVCSSGKLYTNQRTCVEFSDGFDRCWGQTLVLNKVCAHGCNGAGTACNPAPPEPECTHASQCNDGKECTVDSCSNGSCVYSNLTGTSCNFASCGTGECNNGSCQLAQDNCNDNNPCTNDICTTNGCSHTAIQGCDFCTADEQCDDGVACTNDSCNNNTCEYTPGDDCITCSTVSDCPDDPQWSAVTCNTVCEYYDPAPVVHVIWQMPGSWNVDHVEMEGSFCENGAQAPTSSTMSGVEACGSNGTFWNTFPAVDSVVDTTEWSVPTIQSPMQSPRVEAFVPVKAGVRWMIHQWMFANNGKVDWLCNDHDGPKEFDNAWNGETHYGDLIFYAPDGTQLSWEIKPGNNLVGCLFWVNVGTISDLN